MGKSITGTIIVATILIIALSLIGWGIDNRMEEYQSKIDYLQSELEVSELNYAQLNAAFDERDIIEDLPVNDQFEEFLGNISVNNTILHDVVLEYRINSDGSTTGTITVSLSKGDVLTGYSEVK